MIYFTELDEEKKSDDSKFYLIVEMGQNREMNREYLIYDVWSLIGTVGGALGLFVGFSFYDFVLVVVDFMLKKLEKVHPEEPHCCQNLEIGNESFQNSETKQLDVENGSLKSSHRKYQEISLDRIEEITSNAPFNAEKAKPFQIRRKSTANSEIENSGHSKTKESGLWI